MNLERLTGGAAVGAALVVLYTHGEEYTLEEIAAMAVGLGAVVTYVANLIEKFLKEDRS